MSTPPFLPYTQSYPTHKAKKQRHDIVRPHVTLANDAFPHDQSGNARAGKEEKNARDRGRSEAEREGRSLVGFSGGGKGVLRWSWSRSRRRRGIGRGRGRVVGGGMRTWSSIGSCEGPRLLTEPTPIPVSVDFHLSSVFLYLAPSILIPTPIPIPIAGWPQHDPPCPTSPLRDDERDRYPEREEDERVWRSVLSPGRVHVAVRLSSFGQV